MRFKRTVKQLGLPFLLLLTFAAWTLGPVWHNPSGNLPVRETMITTVPIFNAWTIWWNADRLNHGFAGYWDAPIFSPVKKAFAFSEPQPATIIVAPVIWMTGSPALAYNVYLLVSLFLNGVFAFRILRRTGSPRSLAIIGGGMMIWLPVSMRQLEVLQLVPVWSLLWTWDAVRRHGSTPTWMTAVELAASYILSFYICIHHTLFQTITLTGTAWILLVRIRILRFWLTSCVAMIVAGVLVSVIFVPLRQSLRDNAFERSQKLVSQSSALLSDVLRTPNDAIFFPGSQVRLGLSPGWIKILLAAAGTVLGVFRRSRRRWVLFLLLTSVVTGLLAMGPNLKLGGFQPWSLLAKCIPGIDQVRNAFRFVYLTQMAILLLGVSALSELWLRMRTRSWRPITGAIVVNGAALLALAEVPVPKLAMVTVPNLNLHHGWSEFVRLSTPQGKGIACLPFPPGTNTRDFDSTVRWMYLGSLHRVPMINGYSGFFPPRYLRLQAQMNKEGLSEDVLSQLAELKTHFIVVYSSDVTQVLRRSTTQSRFHLQLVYDDVTGIRVYELASSGENSGVTK
jgi:hypothetical protein